MRVGVRQNFKWVLKPGKPLMVVRVEYRPIPGGGFNSIIHCGGKSVEVSLREAGDWLLKYPITAGMEYRGRFIYDIAIPPETAERLNIVNCIEDIITIPPREYLFAVVGDEDLRESKNGEEGGMGKRKTGYFAHWGIV